MTQLTAGSFANLLTICLLRPPRGRFSHLAMFRIGSLLYIPAYLSVILYRVFASENDEGNLVLMGGKSAISRPVPYGLTPEPAGLALAVST